MSEINGNGNGILKIGYVVVLLIVVDFFSEFGVFFIKVFYFNGCIKV